LQRDDGNTMTGADTSIWPIVLTGVFTLVGSLGGISVGLVGSARRDAAQERHEKAKRRADKFEELVAAVYDFDHWVFAIGTPQGLSRAPSPFAKVQSISAVYFPQFSELVQELNAVSTSYMAWVSQARLTLANSLTNSPAEPPHGFNEAYGPYVIKREALLVALSKFAHGEFQ
jgi:hypothetical protein